MDCCDVMSAENIQSTFVPPEFVQNCEMGPQTAAYTQTCETGPQTAACTQTCETEPQTAACTQTCETGPQTAACTQTCESKSLSSRQNFVAPPQNQHQSQAFQAAPAFLC